MPVDHHPGPSLQAALARLLRTALSRPSECHQLAAEELTAALRVDGAAVLLRTPQQRLRLEGVHGWCATPRDGQYQACDWQLEPALDGERVHIPQLPAVEGSSPYADAGIASLAAVPLGPAPRCYGVITVQSCERRSFSPGDFEFLEAVADCLAALLERQQDSHDGARFRQVAELGGVGIWELDDADRTCYINPAARELLGLADDDPGLGRPALDFVAPEDRALVAENLRKRRSGEATEYEVTLLRPDGDRRYILAAGTALSAADGSFAGAIATFVDITDRRRAEQALQASEQRFRALYDHNPAMFFTLDACANVLSVNHFGAEQLGYRVEELTERPMELFYREPAAAVAERLQGCADDLLDWEARLRCRDGGLLWVRVLVRPLQEPGRAPRYLMVCQDISEARELSAELSYQASHDQLTGLPNRREFERRVAALLRELRHQPNHHAVCYIDLDQFKVINDTCGHYAGDELLRQAANALGQVVSRSDTLARLGGDEFGVLLVQCGPEDAPRVAQRLRRVLNALQFSWEGRSFNITGSIGLVPVEQRTQSAGEVLRLADAACYAAKDEGRDRIHIYHDGDVELARRQGEMQWVSRVREALDEDRFCLNYQAIVPVNGGEGGLHYELLVRMIDETGKPVPPGLFLPAAERYNLMVRLDRWVVDAALSWLAMRPDHTEGLGLASINLSGQSLGDEEFLAFVIARLRESGVPPEKLCFEITETAAIGNLDRATRFIEALRAIGCRFALDDFGSGLSSFGYLKNLPVDYLKIDGLFVRDIAEDPIDFAVVKSINEIGQVMGKETIAEFVEDDRILAQLREIGVDYAQGYGIGRPTPLHDF